MKAKKSSLKVVAFVAGAGLCISLFILFDQRRKDKFADSFMDELNKLFNPGGAGLSSEEGFDVNYADEMSKKVTRLLMIKPEVALKYAIDIDKAWGFFDDKEDDIYSVFRSLKDKVQVSQVAKAYKDKFKVNLIEKLRSKLTQDEVSQVLKIVNKLPRYRVV